MFFEPTEEKIKKWESKKQHTKIVNVANHDSALIRVAAVQALGRIGEFEAKDIILAKTMDSDNRVQCAALAALEKYPFPDVVAVLKEHLKSNTTHKNSYQTLQSIANYLSINIEKTIKFMMEMGLPDVSPQKIMQERIAQLVEIGEPALNSVINRIEQFNALDQLVAAVVLGELQSEKAMLALIHNFQNKSEEVVDQIIKSLQSYGDNVVDQLFALLMASVNKINFEEKVIELLVNYPAKTKSAFFKKIKSKDGLAQKSARRLLKRFNWQLETEEEKVLSSFVNNDDRYINYPDIAGPLLLARLDKKDWNSRKQAIDMLAKLNYRKAGNVLMKALIDQEQAVVMSALEAIAVIPLVEAKASLVLLVQDKRSDIRLAAAKALKAIGEKEWSAGIKGTLADYGHLLKNQSIVALDQLIHNMENCDMEERVLSAKIIINSAKKNPDFFKTHWSRLHRLITNQRLDSHKDQSEYRSNDCDYHADSHADEGIGLFFPEKYELDF